MVKSTAMVRNFQLVAKWSYLKTLLLSLFLVLTSILIIFFAYYVPLDSWKRIITDGISDPWGQPFYYYVIAGFIAQMVDGALGMAYGVSATTFLLTVGLPPAVASASVHSSEIFTSGVSGFLHLKFKNVNSKLFKTLVFPGIVGAIIGACLLSSFKDEDQVIRIVVAFYTMFLGIKILAKALQKKSRKKKTKRLGMLGFAGGFLDAIGGGGWGPVVSSKLIAGGRHPLYTIGSVNLAEFFVAVASSVSFVFFIGVQHWHVIIGLVLGGIIAAPIAIRWAKKIKPRKMILLVGILVILLSLHIITKYLWL